MKPNLKCNLCGSPIYRNSTEIKASKSGLFFCSYECKSMHNGGNMYHSVPHTNAIFNATKEAYKAILAVKCSRSEYLTDITLVNPSDKTGMVPYITANARINGLPNLSGKTPSKMEYIRNCYRNITMKDVYSLPMLEKNISWKRIELRYWNENDITYEIW